MNTEKFLFYSGGAIGADTLWAQEAEKHGYRTLAFTFKKHKVQPPAERVILKKEDLEKADPTILKASDRLRRPFPRDNEFVNKLLSRNFHQVFPSVQEQPELKQTDEVYAIGYLDDKGKVMGGTAWAIECVKVYWENGSTGFLSSPSIPVHFFNQETNKWLYADQFSNDKWEEIPLEDIQLEELLYLRTITLIGSREVTPEGQQAIKDIFKNV